MARILRRRVAQMPKVASGRRNLASEINQYLKLGLNAQQIIEKMIPDDPSVTPEMMDPIFDMMALRQGATAPLAQRAAGVQQIAGSMLGQTPAIPVGQPSSEVAKPPSQGLAASPAPSPGAAVPPKSEFFPTLGVDPEQQKFSDDFRSVRRSSMPTGEKIRFAATPGTSPEALVERAEMAQLEEQGSAEMQSGLQAMARAKSQAKAEVSQSIQEAQIAENAEQLKSSFRQMFNAIKEGSGMYDFAGNVEKAMPLFLRAAQASKASSGDVKLLLAYTRKVAQDERIAADETSRKARDKLARDQMAATGANLQTRIDAQVDMAKIRYDDAIKKIRFDHEQRRDTQNSPRSPAVSNKDVVNRRTLGNINKIEADAKAVVQRMEGQIEAQRKNPAIAKLIYKKDGKWEIDRSTSSNERVLTEAGVDKMYGTLLGALNVLESTKVPKGDLEKWLDGATPGASKPAKPRTPEEIKAFEAKAAGVFQPK